MLEIGTGLGYQAALLAEFAAEVYTVELIEELAQSGRRRLDEQGYGNVQFRIGDGSLGWPDHAPYDRIIATAAPDLIPPALLQQLKPGGRMVIPAGLEEDQRLLLVTKDEGRAVRDRGNSAGAFLPADERRRRGRYRRLDPPKETGLAGLTAVLYTYI